MIRFVKGLATTLIVSIMFVNCFSSSAKSSSQIFWVSELHSINFSESVAIKDNFDKWRTDDFQVGNKAYLKQNFFSGVRWNNYELGLAYRYHNFLNYSNDTALWYYLENNDQEQLNNIKEPLNIFLSINQTQGGGLYYKHYFDIGDFEFSSRVTYLRLSELTYGFAEGQYDPQENIANQTELLVDYSYSEDSILDRQVDRPIGNAFLLDLGVRWQSEAHLAELNINDAYSYLAWRRAPASFIEGSLVDLDIRRDAALQFEEFYVSINQPVPVHLQLNYLFTLDSQVQVGINLESVDEQSWYRLQGEYAINNRWTTHFAWAPASGTIGLAVKHSYFLFGIESDAFDIDDARQFNLKFALNIRI